jgi:SAM-dependent MidA family methyltransferase
MLWHVSCSSFMLSPDVTVPVPGHLPLQMVGIWVLATWLSMGQPSKLNLVELGPGRGTLMADLLRGTSGECLEGSG